MRLNPFDIIDISQPISTETACFPGDVAFSRQTTLTYEDSKIVNLTAITLSPHVGTHTDSPAHVRGDLNDPTGLVGALPLDPYIGDCVVLDLSPMESGAINGPLLVKAMEGLENAKKQWEEMYKEKRPWPFRYLIKTQKKCTPNEFKEDYPFLDIDGVELLYARGAKLIGVDTPSVDHVKSKTLDTHKYMIELGINWLENLDLSAVEQGGYFLVAVPIKLMQTEAAPVRALLLKGMN